MPTTASAPGHVFVIQGKIQDVTCDAALIPADTGFSVRSHWWKDVIGLPEQPPMPDTWQENGYAQEERNPRFWYIDVTDNGQRINAADLVMMVSDVVERVVKALPRTPVRRRAQHLVVMPLLGAGGGGLDADESVQLFEALDKLAGACRTDLAIVVPGRDEFEALQLRRRQTNYKRDSQLAHEAQRLGELAGQGGLSLMIGAGVSMGAGLPSWSELLDHLKDGLSSDAEIVNSDDFKALPPLDQAELLQRLRRRGIADEVVEAVTVKESGKAFRPALGHFLLAGLRCRQVATTNYDLLYEAAVRSQGDSQQIHALPYERPAPPNPWILKLHGDVEHDDLVLSRSSFVEYDGRRSATGAVFQAMLLTSHVLFVGLSFTDDNVLRLTHEVTAAPLEGEKTLGTALGLGVSSAKKELWRGVLEWVDLSAPDDHPPRPMGWTKPRETKESADKRWETAWQVRELEIFLDTVALWSVRGEPSCERPPRRLQSDQG